ncbi:TetR/AcrR family transcriptional regulator [Paucibacter sp. PLA-PC-4]|uniref:TetR/AcrR family transcriptional regulator n=1 Tax=Paucibacter sp. PLA-PC-4 TaxID=2993655 RepID=UPI002248D1DA|nr:TetR/AcrR family transcriptional regulator [Paucibacter sp. PLA-PC-4]MCX2861979.1 TetR/AcrR family transcriptional regulator [Paucibacter sp. PLA-PC-4]
MNSPHASENHAQLPRKTGRPRTFDEDQAVETAMHLFWRHGYEGVGMGELTKAIGVAPPSLYGVFGSKASLYRRALDRYSQQFPLVEGNVVREADSLAQAVRMLLATAIEVVTSSAGERSCMVSSGMLCAHPDHDDLAKELGQRRDGFRLEIATLLAPWIEPPRLYSVARHLAAVLQGFSIQARDGATREELLETADEIARGFSDSR